MPSMTGLLHQVLLARGIAERAPQRHAAPFADAVIGIQPGRNGKLARTRFVTVGPSHPALLAQAL